MEWMPSHERFGLLSADRRLDGGDVVRPKKLTSDSATGIAELLAELRAIRAALENRGEGPHRSRRLTVADVAENYGVKEEVVLGWIREGVLKAIDIRAVGKSRPKWRITPTALAEFDMARQGRMEQPIVNKRKSSRHDDVVDPLTGRVRPEFLHAGKKH
jgi:hypothetical protein